MINGDLLKSKRKSLNLSQSALGNIIGVSGAYIQQLEKGLKNPSLDTIDKIANALKINKSVLLGVDSNSLISIEHEKYAKEIIEYLNIISAASDDPTFELEDNLVTMFNAISSSFVTYKSDSKEELINQINSLICNINILLSPKLINNKKTIQSLSEINSFMKFKIQSLDPTVLDTIRKIKEGE